MTQQQQPAEGDTITVYGLRALDALVDQHVMENPKFDAEECREVPGVVTDHWEYGPGGEGPSYCGPHYTTDPRDWMAVVEKMGDDDSHNPGWLLTMTNNDVRGWNVKFDRWHDGDDSGDHVEVTHEQPGVAVCLAAVEAVTGKRVVVEP